MNRKMNVNVMCLNPIWPGDFGGCLSLGGGRGGGGWGGVGGENGSGIEMKFRNLIMK